MIASSNVDRIDRLSGIGFKWALGGRHDEQWNARFKELLEYRSEHGDCDVPVRQGEIGNWVKLKRAAYMACSLALLLRRIASAC